MKTRDEMTKLRNEMRYYKFMLTLWHFKGWWACDLTPGMNMNFELASHKVHQTRLIEREPPWGGFRVLDPRSRLVEIWFDCKNASACTICWLEWSVFKIQIGEPIQSLPRRLIQYQFHIFSNEPWSFPCKRLDLVFHCKFHNFNTIAMCNTLRDSRDEGKTHIFLALSHLIGLKYWSQILGREWSSDGIGFQEINNGLDERIRV